MIKNDIMKVLIVIFSIIFSIPAYSQVWNPFVTSVYILDSPIDLSKSDTAMISFNVGNGGIMPMNDLQNPLRIVVTLFGLRPTNIEDISSSITGANFFDMVYLEDINTVYFEQNQIIPPDLQGGINFIKLKVNVTLFSSIELPKNGFQVNLIPPAYTSLSNNYEDDKAEVMTYTINSLLPIELVEFYAEEKNCDVHLNWKTASELNNDWFVLEKSTDATIWQELKRVKGYGTTNQPQQYEVVDKNANGMVYYRLKQIDYDGTSSTSHVISVQVQNCNGLAQIQIYPNPASNVIFLKNTSEKYSGLDVEFYAANGQLMKKYITSSPLEILDVSQWSAGNYFIKIRNQDNHEMTDHQFVIQR